MRLGRVTETSPLMVEANGDTVSIEAEGAALAVGTEVGIVTVEGRRFAIYPTGGGSGGGVTEHGALSGLADDDHPQYLNNARGDARYLGLTAKAADAALLDGLDSTAFALAARAVPTGGTTGQVLAKASPADYDTGWTDPATGGAGIPAWTAGADPIYTDATASANAPLATGTVANTKVREVILGNGGSLRIAFTAKANTGTGAGFNAQIRRNGVAVGTMRTVNGTTATTFSEDIAGWATGDLLQIYVSATGVSGNTSFVSSLIVSVNAPPLAVTKRL